MAKNGDRRCILCLPFGTLSIIRPLMKPKFALLMLVGTAWVLLFGACTVRNAPAEPPAQPPGRETPEKIPGGPPESFKEGELLVRFKAPPDPKTIEDFCDQTGLFLLHTFQSPGLFLFSITDGNGVREKITEIEPHPLVAYAEPNFIFNLNPPETAPVHVPGEVLVRFAPDTENARIRAILEELDLEMAEALPLPGLYRVKTADPSMPIQDIMKRLNAFSEVMYAEPNYIVSVPSAQ